MGYKLLICFLECNAKNSTHLQTHYLDISNSSKIVIIASNRSVRAIRIADLNIPLSLLFLF